MKFVFKDKSGTTFEANMTEASGLSYATMFNLEILSTELTEPDPMTQAEIEEMLLDQEYRILLLEYGVEEEEPV